MKTILVYRKNLMEKYELEIAKKYFPCETSRLLAEGYEQVIGRFSALPFYSEQEFDYNYLKVKMINTYDQHKYVADLRCWYQDLKKYTFKTWNSLEEVVNEQGPFVLKGVTNSKKHDWNSHMYAEDFAAASNVYSRLADDGFLGYQDIIIRKYQPLLTYFKAIKDLPITCEFRFFVYNGKILSYGFYWDSFKEDFNDMGIETPTVGSSEIKFVEEIVSIIDGSCNFYTVDIGKDVDGKLWLIELNDGQMAGLCGNDPEVLYSNLNKYIE